MSMTVPITEIVELLKREYLFQGMTDEQVTWIAAQFEPVSLEPNEVIFSQGEEGDYFYMLYSGRVRVYRRERGKEAALNILVPGDFFGEEALLFRRPRPATIRTIQRSVVLRMDRTHFNMLLEAYPAIRANLVATADSRRLARYQHYSWLDEDESIYFISRKHDLFLFLSLIPPILMFLASIPVLVFAFAEISSPFFFGVGLVTGILLLLGGIGWGIWNFIDWGNDYYIVTSHRVAWLEKVVGLYDSRQEAPLDTVLAVNVVSNQLGRWLNYGDINVRTYTGGIRMRNASNPARFAAFVEGFRKRAIQISKEEEIRRMNRDLEQALTRSLLPAEGRTVDVPEAPPPPPRKPSIARQPKKRTSFQAWMQNFLKVRYIDGDTITYRKHWFILVRKAWQPFLLFFFWLGLVFGLPLAGLLWDFSIISPMAIALIAILLAPIVFGWLGYHYWDWRNDIYRLTPTQIFDIERKPLGEESKKTANLESILSIEHERENILGVLLNFGNVIVNVGQTEFTFDGVYNPDQVHQDVADYREALNRRKKAAEAEQQRKQMIDWLVAFYHQSEKLGDQEDLSDDDRFSGFSR